MQMVDKFRLVSMPRQANPLEKLSTSFFFSSSIRYEHNHHFNDSATVMNYLSVSMPLAIKPSLTEKQPWDL